MSKTATGIRVRKEAKAALRVRKGVKKRKPSFSRQEGYRLKRLKGSWRRPRGKHSKMRKQERSKGRVPKSGYGSPRAARGLTRYGYREVRVSSPSDLSRLDPSRETALIAGSVGKRKRAEIMKKAEEMKIRVSNARSQNLV